MTKVLDKTEKGREEIATRKYHLSPRIRSLLVMVDGKQSADELLRKVAGLGITDQAVAELLEQGFIREAASAAVESPPGSAGAAAVHREVPAPAETHSASRAVASAPLANGEVAVLPEGQTQFEAIYRFYNETIKSTIGLRGYAPQLKVEKAATIEDFRQLKKPYLEAVLKAQGKEMARSLRDRLDKLLYLGEPAPPETTIVAGLH